MEHQQEGVETIYNEKVLVAIAKRDDTSKKHIVYMLREASSEEIADLIAPKNIPRYPQFHVADSDITL